MKLKMKRNIINFAVIFILINISGASFAQTVPELKSEHYIACPKAGVTLGVKVVGGHIYRWYNLASSEYEIILFNMNSKCRC